MQDAHSVITEATKDCVKQLAAHYEVTIKRIYEMLGNQCVYPKFKRLIRAIALFNPAGVRLIRADLEVLFCEVLGESAPAPCGATLHRETSEAVAATLAGKTRGEQLKEWREASAAAIAKVKSLEADEPGFEAQAAARQRAAVINADNPNLIA